MVFLFLADVWKKQEVVASMYDVSLMLPQGEQSNFSKIFSHFKNHKLVPIASYTKKRNCAYCFMIGRKYNSGNAVRSYLMCDVCNVALCKMTSDCFYKFHEYKYQNPDASIPSSMLAL